MFGRIEKALARTQERISRGIGDLLTRADPDPAMSAEDLEAALIGADLGLDTTQKLVAEITERLGRRGRGSARRVREVLAELLRERLGSRSPALVFPPEPPAVFLMVGVNGVGKTTTIGKLAHRFQGEGRKVLLVAGDTFRAAAIEQLEAWGERTGSAVIKNRPESDPAAVVFDGISAARGRGADIAIVDTAGRLHTKRNLMEELKKIKRVSEKALPQSPHEVLLVMDATTGQNGLAQARQFHEAVGLTGVVLSKLDGTAKGGVVVAIGEELGIPVKLVGVGEGPEDLVDFDPEAFIRGILGEEAQGS
ncbi:MAG TPA: signal recognition particle-docking protein FtsY [Nitrospiria bacterium]